MGFHLNSQKRKTSSENMFDFKSSRVETDEVRARIESLIKLSRFRTKEISDRKEY